MSPCATFEVGSMNSEVRDVSSGIWVPTQHSGPHVGYKDLQQEYREDRRMQST
jgi:hypothetical protein